MVATVRVNERTVVHKTSGGMSVAFPDPCLTPGAGPIPYLNVALSEDAENTSVSVFADGQGVMLKDSFFAKSVGDEPGTDGGVISGTYQGKASFSNYSFDVMIEGRNVCRLGDPMIHNHGSPPNGNSPAELQPDIDTTKEMLCAIVCFCNFPGGYTECVRQHLATPRTRPPPPAFRRYWDPHLPGIYVEVPFDMSEDPPRPMMDSDERSNHPAMRDPADPSKGMRLPGGDLPPVEKSRRPDIVIAKNPNLPLDAPGNIDKIYEIKYPGDRWRPGQKEAYEKIAPDRVVELTPEKCGCTEPEVHLDPVLLPGEEPERDRVPAPGGLSTPEKVGVAIAIVVALVFGPLIIARLFGKMLVPSPSPI
jgi:hypothetical protein